MTTTSFLPVHRGPTMTGPQIEYHYMREVEIDPETGAIIRQIDRHPVAFRVLPSQEWITEATQVEAAFSDLFARDAAYAKAQAALGPMFVGEDGEPQGAARIDSDGVVNLLLPADRQPERWLEVAVAVSVAAPDEANAGTIAVEWVG